ncbi:MAG TPA: hypothetical protein VD905_01830 [Flavobacteriales bacterium]|nr:hypothetical protein [Flavobacteriales bacterium]
MLHPPKKVITLFLLLCFGKTYSQLVNTSKYEATVLTGHKSAYGWLGMKFGININPYLQCTAGAGFSTHQARTCAGLNIWPLPQYRLTPYFVCDYSYALPTNITYESMYETYTLKSNHYVTPSLCLRFIAYGNINLKIKAGYSFLLNSLDKTVYATSQKQTQWEQVKTDLSGGFCIAGGLSVTFRVKQKTEPGE